jgi:hypothetical protein
VGKMETISIVLGVMIAVWIILVAFVLMVRHKHKNEKLGKDTKIRQG